MLCKTLSTTPVDKQSILLEEQFCRCLQRCVLKSSWLFLFFPSAHQNGDFQAATEQHREFSWEFESTCCLFEGISIKPHVQSRSRRRSPLAEWTGPAATSSRVWALSIGPGGPRTQSQPPRTPDPHKHISQVKKHSMLLYSRFTL